MTAHKPKDNLNKCLTENTYPSGQQNFNAKDDSAASRVSSMGCFGTPPMGGMSREQIMVLVKEIHVELKKNKKALE